MEDREKQQHTQKKKNKKGTVDGIMELERENTTSLIPYQHHHHHLLQQKQQQQQQISTTTSSSDGSDSPPMDSDALLQRRNTLPPSMIPTKLDIPIKLQSSSFPITNGDKISLPNGDFELFSLRSKEYTSLKDLMIPGSPSAAAIQSPRDSGIQSCYEISIRNRLVKQAAWAYLQPMSSSPDSSGRYSFQRMWIRFSSVFPKNPVNACFGFIHRRLIPTISRAFNRLLGAIGVLRNRGEKQ